jgi:flagella basal body P-ring formation protein FlgA
MVLAVGLLAGLTVWGGSEGTVRTADAAPVPQEEVLTKALRQYVAEALTIDASAVIVRILTPQDGLAGLPGGALITHVGSGKPVGRVTFLVGAVRIASEVEAFKEVVVASRFLRRNQVLEDDDLARSAIRLMWREGRYLGDSDLAVGKRLTRGVPAQFPITEDILSQPYAIRQGARVTIQYVKGPLKILTSGIAKDDGPVGATIRVTNPDYKKDVWALVLDAGTVQVGP